MPNLPLELDQLVNALFFLALLLYLIPAVFGLGSSPELRRRFYLAAIVTLGTAIAIALVASVTWFTRRHRQDAHLFSLMVSQVMYTPGPLRRRVSTAASIASAEP